MNHNILKQIIFDNHRVIKEAEIVPREISFENGVNYILAGLRRSGKSTQLYRIVRELVKHEVDWNRIIYINFEDERLSEFSIEDFNDILMVQSELSEENGYFFFDEIQNISGWEKFARRMADSGQRVCITGSNANMLSREMEKVLGGRYISKKIEPYNFREYLLARGLEFEEKNFWDTRETGKIRRMCREYLTDGGLPESLKFGLKREYISSVYNKILLGDIISRNNIRNEHAMRLLVKKLAETVTDSISYTKLYGILRAIPVSISKDSVIDYISYAKDAYLIFSIKNFYGRFAEKESIPKYYFSDNGILNLFLTDRDSSLLENLVALRLQQRYKDEVYFLKDAKKGIDVDFYTPEDGVVIQASYSLSESSIGREIGNLVKATRSIRDVKRCRIVTMEEEGNVEKDGVTIEVLPLYRFLLE